MEHDNETTYPELLAAIKPARTPSWRTMLRDRRGTRAKLAAWDRDAAMYAAQLPSLTKRAEAEHRAYTQGRGQEDIETVRPPRGGSR